MTINEIVKKNHFYYKLALLSLAIATGGFYIFAYSYGKETYYKGLFEGQRDTAIEKLAKQLAKQERSN